MKTKLVTKDILLFGHQSARETSDWGQAGSAIEHMAS